MSEHGFYYSSEAVAREEIQKGIDAVELQHEPDFSVLFRGKSKLQSKEEAYAPIDRDQEFDETQAAIIGAAYPFNRHFNPKD